jgi:hypothetical protein
MKLDLIQQTLAEMDSEITAQNFLFTQEMTRAELNQLAKIYAISFSSKDNKAIMIKTIVSFAVGVKSYQKSLNLAFKS